MKHFEPLRTYLSPCLTARVRMPDTSEPASGSVRQNEARFGASSRFSAYSFLTSSEAPMKIGAAARPLAPSEVWMPEQPQASSSSMRQPSRNDRPGPPYSSGAWVFIRPTSWALSMTSCGQVPSLSYSQATGRISFSAKSCAMSRRFFCSSVRVKSTTWDQISLQIDWSVNDLRMRIPALSLAEHQPYGHDAQGDGERHDEDQPPLLGKDGRLAGREGPAAHTLPHWADSRRGRGLRDRALRRGRGRDGRGDRHIVRPRPGLRADRQGRPVAARRGAPQGADGRGRDPRARRRDPPDARRPQRPPGRPGRSAARRRGRVRPADEAGHRPRAGGRGPFIGDRTQRAPRAEGSGAAGRRGRGPAPAARPGRLAAGLLDDGDLEDLAVLALAVDVELLAVALD